MREDITLEGGGAAARLGATVCRLVPRDALRAAAAADRLAQFEHAILYLPLGDLNV